MIGKGSTEKLLTESEVHNLCTEAFAKESLKGKRVLAIIPDLTRTAPIDIMFRVVHDLIIDRVEQLDFIVALGTHPPMSDKAINQRVGITASERASKYKRVRFFNHLWDNPGQLRSVGRISKSEVEELSDGLMSEVVDVKINKIVFDYDVLLIIGPTFPHEVVGFSGGNKYLFPGIAGQEIIDMFHWLGALITSPKIIGTGYTPVRKVVDMAASLLPMQRLCMSLVVKGSDLAGLYIGTPEEAWASAAKLSAQLHIIFKEKPFHKILSCSPIMYDDLWTGAKCAYKLEPVVEDGGELIIFAPHIKEISVTHGKQIEEIGYHVRDYFTKQMEKFSHIPGGVLAHSTHVKGAGNFENGIERPRINVVLATQIPENVCKKINMGYRDPRSINISEWQNREEDGILYVPKGGETLYRLKNR